MLLAICIDSPVEIPSILQESSRLTKMPKKAVKVSKISEKLEKFSKIKTLVKAERLLYWFKQTILKK